MTDRRLQAVFRQTPESRRLPPGISFKVTSYSQVDEWTLVQWRMGGEDEYATGETLYRRNRQVASTGGKLDLYEETKASAARSKTPPARRSLWDRADKRIGKYGLPPALAAQLRSPRSQAFLGF